MSDRRRRCQEIVLAVMKRRADGESVPDEIVLARHPDLVPELEEELRRARILRMAAERADAKDGPSPSRPERPVALPPPSADPRKPADASRPLGDSASDVHLTLIEPDGEDAKPSIVPSAPRQPVTAARSRQAPATLFRPAIRPSMAMLKVHFDNPLHFEIRPIMGDRFAIGRQAGDMQIPHDGQISSPHAEIQRRCVDGKYCWYLVDLGSASGTFARTEQVRLKVGDELLLGSGRYRFCQGPGDESSLVQVNENCENQPWILGYRDRWIGRATTAGLPLLREDSLLDLRHAHLYRDQARWCLKDAKSRNGVWVRINEVRLIKACAFQLGEQRFGFAIM